MGRSLPAFTLALPFLFRGGCSGADHFTGTVSTFGSRLCLARPEAAGDCFLATGQQLKGLRINECVTVTYTPGTIPDEGPQGTVTNVEASNECSQWN